MMVVVLRFQHASCLPRLVGGQYVLRLQVIRSSVQETHVDKVIAHWLRVLVLIALQANASQHCDWCCCCCGHRHVWECVAGLRSRNQSAVRLNADYSTSTLLSQNTTVANLLAFALPVTAPCSDVLKNACRQLRLLRTPDVSREPDVAHTQALSSWSDQHRCCGCRLRLPMTSQNCWCSLAH